MRWDTHKLGTKENKDGRKGKKQIAKAQTNPLIKNSEQVYIFVRKSRETKNSKYEYDRDNKGGE